MGQCGTGNPGYDVTERNLKIKMKLQNMKVLSMAAVLSVTLLAGCANERLEDELSYRKIGIESMQSGELTAWQKGTTRKR